MKSWHVKWIGGVIAVPAFFYVSRSAYFNCYLAFPHFSVPTSGCATIYDSMYKAQIIYGASLLGAYLALYVLVSLNAKKISKREAAIHLIAWTLVPPLWFSFERYFYFQGPVQEAKLLDSDPKQKERDQKLKVLKEGQDYAGKLWGGILAVLLAFKLGEIVKDKDAPHWSDSGGTAPEQSSSHPCASSAKKIVQSGALLGMPVNSQSP